MGLLDALFNPSSASPQDNQQAGLLASLLGAAGGAFASSAPSRLPVTNGQVFGNTIGGGFQGLQGYNANRLSGLQAKDVQSQIAQRDLANQVALNRYNMLANYMGWPGMNGTQGRTGATAADSPAAPPASDPGGYGSAAKAMGVPSLTPTPATYGPRPSAPSSSPMAGLPDMRPAILSDMLVPGSGKTVLDKTMPGPSALASLYAERNAIAAQNPADPRLPEYDTLIAKTAGDPGYLARSTQATEGAKFPFALQESIARYAGRPTVVGNAVLPGYRFLPPSVQANLGVPQEGGSSSPSVSPGGSPSATPSGAPPYSGLTKLPGGGYVNTGKDSRLASLDSELLKGMNETAEKSHQSQMTTREGLDLLNNFQTGRLGDAKLNLMQWARALGADQSTINGITGIKTDNAAAGEALNKVFLQITANAVRVMGAREPGSVISMFKSAYPSLEVRPETAKLMLNLVDQQYQRDIDRVQAAGKFLKNNPNNYLSTDFDAYFNKAHPVGSYIQTAYKKAGMTEGDLNKLASSGQPNPVGEIREGATASNPKTGQRIIFRGGQWQPLQ